MPSKSQYRKNREKYKKESADYYAKNTDLVLARQGFRKRLNFEKGALTNTEDEES